jgi:hypothetical protein
MEILLVLGIGPMFVALWLYSHFERFMAWVCGLGVVALALYDLPSMAVVVGSYAGGLALIVAGHAAFDAVFQRGARGS